jgi:hypothetical protein
MKLRLILTIFCLLYFRHASAEKVISVILVKNSPTTEAFTCTSCKDTSSHSKIPDLGSAIANIGNQIQSLIAEKIKSKHNKDEIKVNDLLEAFMTPKLKEWEKELQFQTDIFVISLTRPNTPASSNDPNMALNSTNSLIPEQDSITEFRRFTQGQTIGFRYNSKAEFEEATGLKFNIIAGQELRAISSGPMLKGTVEEIFSPSNKIIAQIFIQGNGQKTATVFYNYNLK